MRADSSDPFDNQGHCHSHILLSIILFLQYGFQKELWLSGLLNRQLSVLMQQLMEVVEAALLKPISTVINSYIV